MTRPGQEKARVDGNAIAGMLSDIFNGDTTMLAWRCGTCGTSGPMAEAIVDIDPECAIVLCRGCTHTLFTLFRDETGVSVRLAALGSLHIARSVAS